MCRLIRSFCTHSALICRKVGHFLCNTQNISCCDIFFYYRIRCICIYRIIGCIIRFTVFLCHFFCQIRISFLNSGSLCLISAVFCGCRFHNHINIGICGFCFCCCIFIFRRYIIRCFNVFCLFRSCCALIFCRFLIDCLHRIIRSKFCSYGIFRNRKIFSRCCRQNRDQCLQTIHDLTGFQQCIFFGHFQLLLICCCHGSFRRTLCLLPLFQYFLNTCLCRSDFLGICLFTGMFDFFYLTLCNICIFFYFFFCDILLWSLLLFFFRFFLFLH